ncbi:MAG: ribosome biogenesis GTPase YlqF [Pseudomonadales bacterium]|nr:ribosome biogenesis GTPase YlqF [Pseudomonadales bacterium]MCP5331030.1 ribosome biogenesis GTPase YlqF [Pseudomonadales bacterium]MCP5343492.1 ribosome biogenesis GTPase YlqF [Pseudomonadales bacterium]
MTISWYPGHMHKANKEMAALIKQIDVVIEVLDARMPQASSNPLLKSMREGKPCLHILNKADLADPRITRQWLDYFRAQPLAHAAASGKDKRIETADVLHLCRVLLRKVDEARPKRAEPKPEQDDNPDLAALRAWKKENKKHQILIVGIPNVGKSSIMNQLLGRKIARTGNEPAITKGQQRVRLKDNWFLVDTPGVLWPKLEDQAAAYRLAMSGAIRNTAIEFLDVAQFAAKTLLEEFPERLQQRYGLQTLPADGEGFLRELALARGCVRKDQDIDWNRVAELLINDYRAGRFGPMSLERPPVEEISAQA